MRATVEGPIPAQGLGDHLDGDFPPESGVLGPVYLGHAPRPEQRHYQGRPESRASDARAENVAQALAGGPPPGGAPPDGSLASLLRGVARDHSRHAKWMRLTVVVGVTAR